MVTTIEATRLTICALLVCTIVDGRACENFGSRSIRRVGFFRGDSLTGKPAQRASFRLGRRKKASQRFIARSSTPDKKVYLQGKWVKEKDLPPNLRMSLEDLQSKMEREAPGFEAVPLQPQQERREARLNESAVRVIRVAVVGIVALLTYSILLINGDVKPPTWLDF
ncbi:hypothetical protein AAMO2058_000726400 [Amorphochlora amoebiformis]